MTYVTYADLMAASGTLDRAARYLLATYGSSGSKLDETIITAMGILSGLAYTVRPQLIRER